MRRLRRTLGDDNRTRIVTHAAGYMVSVESGELDLQQFASLQASAEHAVLSGAWDQASAHLRAALGLWRGQPLADVPSDLLVLRDLPRLAEMRQQALEARIVADLHLGRHRALVPELRALSAQDPLRECYHAQLMLALYRCDRQAEALLVYQQARRVLVDELGIEPGPELQQLHWRILAGDPSLAAEIPKLPAGMKPGPQPQSALGEQDGLTTQRCGGLTGPAVPRELPAGPYHFVGRSAELAMLTGLLEQVDGAPGTARIWAISGTAGVGKTALAVQWAHQVADRFPDGQLHVNLRGFDRTAEPTSSAEAIRGFLSALQVPPARMPAELDAQAGLYRSLLADKRMLVVLDNARDAGQVRPLLPASPTCVAVVTSRCQLTGLAAAEGARLLALEVLSEPEAREFLVCRLDGGQVVADPLAVAELTGLCERLPLALAIAAARAAACPSFPLAALVGDLRQLRNRLDALDTGDAATSMRAVLSWSYQDLAAAPARMFRLLGVHPGPDITAPAAASIAAIPLVKARQLLRELTSANLLAEHAPGRFAFHDLLRSYSAELAGLIDDEADRRTAVLRSLDHYLHTANAADLLLYPARDSITLARPQPGVAPETLVGHDAALAWFQAEHKVLLMAVIHAAETGFDTHAWQLPWALADFFDRQGHWHDWAAVQHTALAAAMHLGDLAGQARAHRALGTAHLQLGSYSTARTQLRNAFGLFRQLGDAVGQARVSLDLAWAAGQQGRHRAELGHAQQALDLFQAVGNRAGEGRAVNIVGWSRAQLGNYQCALDCCQKAVGLCAECGDCLGEAAAWDSLGYVHQHLGDYSEASVCFQRAIRLTGQISARYHQAASLGHLGDAHRANSDPDAARHAWQLALATLDDLQHPDADHVRAELNLLDAAVATHDGSRTPPGRP